MAKMITKQKGATPILIALLLLLISTAVTLYVGKVTTNETRLRSDNSQRIESYNSAMTGFYQAVSWKCYLPNQAVQCDLFSLLGE